MIISHVVVLEFGLHQHTLLGASKIGSGHGLVTAAGNWGGGGGERVEESKPYAKEKFVFFKNIKVSYFAPFLCVFLDVLPAYLRYLVPRGRVFSVSPTGLYNL